jgi:hypothetical protein
VSRLSRDTFPFLINFKVLFMNRLLKRHFWEWFKRHQHEYKELKKKPMKEVRYLLNELNAHLRAYFKFFGFTMIWTDEQSTTLIITVKGKAMHFKKVEAFVATAPDIPGWKICALEDAAPIDFALDTLIEAAGIHPGEFYFCFDDIDADCTDIIVYHPLCTHENEHRLLELAYAAVYNLMGERAFGTDIGRIEVANLSTVDQQDIGKLEDLPDCIGVRKGTMVVGEDGKLVF